MRYLQFYSSLFLSTFLLLSCSGNGANSTGKDSSGTAVTSADAGSSGIGSASWSAVIDGQAVSGTGIDGLQQRNAAYIVPVGSNNDKEVMFWLFDTKDGADDAKFSHSIKLYVPDKAATFPINEHSPYHSTYGMTLNIILDDTHSARYYTKDITVTITSLTSSRVSGTFSGTLQISPDTPNAPKKEVTVSDGKFDIPMATSKIIPS